MPGQDLHGLCNVFGCPVWNIQLALAQWIATLALLLVLAVFASMNLHPHSLSIPIFTTALAMWPQAPSFSVVHGCQLHILKDWWGVAHQLWEALHEKAQWRHELAACHCD
jgi:hypothetical protein